MKSQCYCLRMLLTTVPLLLAVILERGSRVAGLEQFSERDLENYYKRMYDFGLGKRAYTYSANKRPMYDFGIGKRDGQKQRLYAFGLGKRAATDVEEYYDDEARDDYTKRLKPYEFGLGKRLAPSPYSFGLGKRAGGTGQGKLYSFGLGKRQAYPEDEEDYDQSSMEKRSRYQFGLGKRSPLDRLYNGNSDRSLRSQRYNFGLGKRDLNEELEEYSGEDSGQHHDIMARSMKYGFGLGKREISKEALDELDSSLLNSDNISAAMLLNGKSQHTSNPRKRAADEETSNNHTNENQKEIDPTTSYGDKPETHQRR